MSLVTNVILHIPLGDDEGLPRVIGQVNTFLAPQSLVSVEDPSLPHHWYGGGKFLETNLYLGAINYLDLDGFVAHLRRIPWGEDICGEVQLIVMEQHDEGFRVIDIFDDRV